MKNARKKPAARRPARVLENLRNLIDEAETALRERGGRLADEQLADLRMRFQAGLGRLRECSHDAGDRLRDYWDQAGDRLHDYREDMSDRIRSGAERTKEAVQEHPVRTTCMIVGVLLIAGSVLAPRFRRDFR